MGLPQFGSSFPGVKQATLAPARGAASSPFVQFWKNYDISSADGGYRIGERMTWMKGDTDAIGHLCRGDLVTIVGIEYQAVTDAEDDENGVAVVYLEPAP